MTTDDPGSIGLSKAGVERAEEMLRREVEAGQLMGAALQMSRGGDALAPICVGRRRLAEGGPAVERDTIFLIASITKPIVAAAVMKLVEEGQVALDEPAATYVPEFGAEGKENVQLRHLLTHTSGLPDQIDRNREYRRAKRSLSDFVERICELPLLFEPGTAISYQSCGIAMLGEIVERVTGQELREYLKTVFFDPLGLQDTSLGIAERSDRESDVKLAGEGLTFSGGGGTDYDWNSDYWRNFGAPWGGMLTTVGEMTTLMQAFLQGGTVAGTRILGKAAVMAMVADQTADMPGLSGRQRRAQRWGLGWRLQTRTVSTYGDLASDRSFGHGGATGTIAWADPSTGVTCVLFTNDPAAASRLRSKMSNVIAGAVE